MPKQKPRYGFRAKLLFLLLMLGLAAVVAVPMLQRDSDRTAPVPITSTAVTNSETGPAADIAALQSRLDAQEQRIAVLEKQLATPPEAAESIKPEATPSPVEVLQMGQQIAETRSGLEALRNELRHQGLPVRHLQLWVLLQQVAQNVANGGSVALPVAQLQEAWVGSAPNELEALRSLSRLAEERIPTEGMLMEDFVALRSDVSIGLLQKEAGLWARIKAMLRQQVRIRRLDETGEALPSDPLAALDQAQDALAEGQIAEAIRRVEAVPQGKAAFESWLEAATRRVEAQAAVDTLQQSLLTQLTAQAPAPALATPAADHDAAE